WPRLGTSPVTPDAQLFVENSTSYSPFATFIENEPLLPEVAVVVGSDGLDSEIFTSGTGLPRSSTNVPLKVVPVLACTVMDWLPVSDTLDNDTAVRPVLAGGVTTKDPDDWVGHTRIDAWPLALVTTAFWFHNQVSPPVMGIPATVIPGATGSIFTQV